MNCKNLLAISLSIIEVIYHFPPPFRNLLLQIFDLLKMTNFQLKYELLVVFDKIILCFLSTVFAVIFNKIILHFLSAKMIYNKVMEGHKVFKLEFVVEVIIIFVKNVEKGIKCMLTLLVSQLYKQQKFTGYVTFNH